MQVGGRAGWWAWLGMIAILMIAAAPTVAGAQPSEADREALRTTDAFRTGDEAFATLSDAGLFETVNRLTTPEYWSMDSLGSNAPAMDLITRRRRRTPEGQYLDTLISTRFTLRLDGNNPGLADVRGQVQPTTFDAERGFATYGIRLQWRYSTDKTTGSANGTDYDIRFDRYWIAPRLIEDLFGFKFIAGPSFALRESRATPVGGGASGQLAQQLDIGFGFALARVDRLRPEPFEWAVTRFDISFTEKFWQDAELEFRWVDVPEADPATGLPLPRLWEITASIRYGATFDRRVVGLRGRYGPVSAAIYHNYYENRFAWFEVGGEYRVDFLILEAAAGAVLPRGIGQELRFNFRARIAGQTADAIDGFRLQLYVGFELSPYAYDTAVGTQAAQPQRLDAGLILYW